MTLIDGAGRAALSWAYPPACAACGEAAMDDGALCAACWRAVEFIGAAGCRRCGAPSAADPQIAHASSDAAAAPQARCDACRSMEAPWRRAHAAARYGGAARDLTLAFKHRDRMEAGRAMARFMAVAGRGVLEAGPTVCPIPLHWTRRLGRRFNQSAELARWICAATGGPAPVEVLRRVRRTPSLGRLSPEDRRAAVDGAFAIRNAAAQRAVEGATVVLVDDVLTTGATAAEAARTLLAAGAASVDLLVFARAARDPFAARATD